MSENKDTMQILQAVHGVSERVARLEAKLDEYNKIRANAYSASDQARQNYLAIQELKSNQRWGWRTILTTTAGLLCKIIYDAFKGV